MRRSPLARAWVFGLALALALASVATSKCLTLDRAKYKIAQVIFSQFLTNEGSRAPRFSKQADVDLCGRQPASIAWPLEARKGEWAFSLDRTSLVRGVTSASAKGRVVNLHATNALQTPA
jgi:hypothetical protein